MPDRARNTGGWALEGVAIVALVLLAWRSWEQMGAYPTGLDGGNWLAFGRGLVGDGKSTEGAYPPAIPLMMEVSSQLGEAILGARLLAVGTLVLPPLALFAVLRPVVGSWFGLSAGVLIACFRPLREAAAYGGYPQNAAIALAVVACASFGRYLEKGDRRSLLLAAGAASATAFTHHLYFVGTLGWMAAIVGVWLVAGRGDGLRIERFRERFPGIAVIAGAGVVSFAPTGWLLVTAGFSPAFNAAETGLWNSWLYASRDATVAWTLVLGLGIASLIYLRGEITSWPWLVSASGYLVSVAGFLFTEEARLLPITIISAGIAIALGLDRFASRLRSTALAGIPIALTLPVLILVPIADRVADEDYDYYQTVDADMLEAISWVDEVKGTVAVRANARGWPVGWWYEGLTETHILVGSDLQWLAYPEEQENARLVALFFVRGQGAELVRELGARHGVDYLLFGRREWLGWTAWQEQDRPATLKSNKTYMLVELRAGP